MPLRVALFVEAGHAQPPPRGDAPLFQIWGVLLREALRLPEFVLIEPISKKHLVAMDPSNPSMSGSAEALDKLITRKLGHPPTFDAALIAWDLVPAWNPEAATCRWRETLDLYQGLAQSDALPQLWRDRALERHTELSGRPTPSARVRPPTLQPGVVLPLCMTPMFEGMLVGHEAGARRAFGVEGEHVKGWPAGWGDPTLRHPDRDTLAPAVRALRGHQPQPDVTRKIRGDLRTHKDDWGAWLLRGLLQDPIARPTVEQHPICQRLRELVGR